MNNLTIIDVSSAIYSICAICSKEENEYKNDFTYYKEQFDLKIQQILEDTKANEYLMFGDGYTSFRKQEFSTFKSDRKSKPILQFLTDLKQHSISKWGMIYSNIFEADDLVLIHNNELSEQYNVIIAAIDSDLKQNKGTFFDYAYYRKKTPLEEAFSMVAQDKAEMNLWTQVLIKGHNAKVDYLEGCGKVSALKYLVRYSQAQLKLASLNAFIYGINKEIHKISKNIKGYGLIKGIDKFRNAFSQTYLLRKISETLIYDIEFTLSNPIKVPEKENTNDTNTFL